MEIGGPQVPNYIIGGDGSIVRCKVAEIGAWNMDTTQGKAVAFSITMSKLLAVTGIIWNDAGTTAWPIAAPNDAGPSTVLDVNIQQVVATGAQLYRRTGGMFDSANFDDAVMNRGYLLIWYKD